MLGVIVLLLVIAMPLGIVMLSVKATEAERAIDKCAPASRLACALVFGLAATLGVLWVVRGSGAMGWFLIIPASCVAAILAAVSQPFLVGPSKAIAAFSGVAIAVLTPIITSSLIAIAFAPSSASLFLITFGAVLALSSSLSIPVLLIGGLAGLLLSHLSNRKHPGSRPGPEMPSDGAFQSKQ